MVKIDGEKLDHHRSSFSHKSENESESNTDGDDSDFDPMTRSGQEKITTRSGARRASNDTSGSSYRGSHRSTRRRASSAKQRLLRNSSDEEDGTDEEDEDDEDGTEEESNSGDESETMDEENDNENSSSSRLPSKITDNGTSSNINDKNDAIEQAHEGRATRRRTQIYPSYNEKWIMESRKYEVRSSSRTLRHTRRSESLHDVDNMSINVRQDAGSYDGEDTTSRRTSRRFKEPIEDSIPNGDIHKAEDNSEQVEHGSETRRSKRQEMLNDADEDVQGDMYSRLKSSHSRRKSRVNYSEFLRVTTRSSHDLDHGIGRGRRDNGIDAEPVSRRLRERKCKEPGRAGIRPSIDALLHKARKKRLRRKRRRSNSSASSGSRSSSSSSGSSIDGSRANRSRSKPFDKPAKAGSKKGFQDLQPNEIDPSITFQSMGGLDVVIEKLRETVVLPLVYKEFYSSRNIIPPKGILFHGPPGTGKTMLARALANECSTLGGQKVTFFIRKGGDLLSKWVGESERQIRKLFEQASISQPSIIFFDEIDGLAPIRSSKTDQVHNSVVSTLLAELDGVKDRGDIIIIGATNRIDSIDPALRRPGRFDHEFAFLLPTVEGRAQILKSHTSKWKGDEVPETVIDEVATRTVGFSGADLKLLCAEASVVALRRRYPQIYASTNKYLLDYNSVKVEPVDWIQAMNKIKPSSARSLNSILTTGHPLPKAVVPLLEYEVSEISKRIASMFPLIECPEFMREPAPKRFLICARYTDNGMDQYILPAVLHRFESVPVFTLSLESVLLQDSNLENSAIARVFNEADRVNKLAIILIPSFNILLESMTVQTQTLLCERIMNATSKPIFILATAQLEQQKEKRFSLNEPSDGEENNSDADTTSDIPPRFLNFFNGRSYTLSCVPRKTRKAFFHPLLTQQALLVRDMDREDKPLEELPLAPPPPPKMLSPDQIKNNQKKETSMLRHLRKFLREMLSRLFRNKKFQDFIHPIDKSEVPDYYDIIQKPMTLIAMLGKLNQGVYLSAHDLLEDILLIRDNAVAYNPSTPEGLNIISRAEELVDYANLIIEDEMDSDFEEGCQKIANERKVRVSEVTVKVEQVENSAVESNTNTTDGQHANAVSAVAGSTKTPAGSSSNGVLPQEGPSEPANTSAVAIKNKNGKRKLRRGKKMKQAKKRKLSASDVPPTLTSATAIEKTREKSQSPASYASSSGSGQSQASKRSNQSIVHELSPSSASGQDLDNFKPSCESMWSPNNPKLKKCTNFEVYEKTMKKLVSDAANATDGLGVNRILDLRYKLLLLIERHYGEDDKDNAIEKIKETIKCFVSTEKELRRDPNGVEVEGLELEDSESR